MAPSTKKQRTTAGIAKKPAANVRNAPVPAPSDASIILNVSTFLSTKKLGLFSNISRVHAAATANVRSYCFWNYASRASLAIRDELAKGRNSLVECDPSRGHRNVEYANMCKHFKRAIKLAKSMSNVLHYHSETLSVMFDFERLELDLEFVAHLPTSPGQQGWCLECAAYLDCDGSEDNYHAAFSQRAVFFSAPEAVKREQVSQHLSALRVVQLRQELSKRCLSEAGRKAEMVDRLLHYLFNTRVLCISLRLDA